MSFLVSVQDPKNQEIWYKSGLRYDHDEAEELASYLRDEGFTVMIEPLQDSESVRVTNA